MRSYQRRSRNTGALILALLMASAVVPAPASPSSPSSDEEPATLPESIPAEAEQAMRQGEASYRTGNWREALTAFSEAEAAGARSGMLFYRMGYCHSTLGDRATALRYKRQSVPYLRGLVEAGDGGIDPYYYLAATYTNDLGDTEQGADVASAAIDAVTSGKIADLDGDEQFRLGRLYGFALAAAPEEKKAELRERQTQAYRDSADRIVKQRERNRSYLMLASLAVADAARKAGDNATAIQYYGRASAADPTDPTAGRALEEMARAASRRGDLKEAVSAWLGIRGPGDLKTPAQYGLKLARQGLELGELPDEFEDRPMANLDAATLERGILAASEVLRTEEMAERHGESSGQDPDEVGRSRRLFVALCLTYLTGGHDLRMFVLSNQLVPFVFG